ncbi:hypothetical protein ACFQZO_23950 [Bradyrhizobium sp. GCM10027634]|uniref:hypothetical protein n=1 Tax=unclassified Bradyrhizobium TaxID=2631580 RepID=UPI00188A477D|nr:MULTISPECIES: hypothetical protein [unclassified Bradyrhizobium]MDN5003894.1 hypothetical protein [Bradyrhizobium sp. WYCCWR 12677]QOZ45444.1 hypothetical protein XH89_19600 [Bradyrhizobium sp. CCBAU 53340]
MALQHGGFDLMYIAKLLDVIDRSKDRWPYIHRKAADELANIERNLARPADGFTKKVQGS